MSLPKEIQDQLTKSFEAFRNRTIHKTLTAELIDATPDNELMQIVFDNLTTKPFAVSEYATVMSWNKSRQAIYMIWVLEGEVNNGGYNQFYSNSSGQFYKHLPDALKLVGANQFAALTEKANATYEKEYEKITRHQDGTTEGFGKSYEDNPLNEFDTEFYALYQTEDIQKIQIEFIREHKSEFVDA